MLLEELMLGLEPFESATVYHRGQEYKTSLCLPQVVKGLQQSMQKSCFETGSGKAFLSTAKKKKGITERCGTLNTISEKDLEKDPILLAASLYPRYRKMKCMAAEDGASVQGAGQILSTNEAKVNRSAGDSLQQH